MDVQLTDSDTSLTVSSSHRSPRPLTPVVSSSHRSPRPLTPVVSSPPSPRPSPLAVSSPPSPRSSTRLIDVLSQSPTKGRLSEATKYDDDDDGFRCDVFKTKILSQADDIESLGSDSDVGVSDSQLARDRIRRRRKEVVRRSTSDDFVDHVQSPVTRGAIASPPESPTDEER